MKTQFPLWLFMTLWLIAGVAALLISAVPDARAQTCMSKDLLLRNLAEGSNEHPVWTGKGTVGPYRDQTVIKTASVTGKWHLIVVKNGFACVIGRGTDSHDMGFRT